jgi:hypothetical protein
MTVSLSTTTSPSTISSAFAAGAVDEPGAEDGEDVVPSAF